LLLQSKDVFFLIIYTNDDSNATIGDGIGLPIYDCFEADFSICSLKIWEMRQNSRKWKKITLNSETPIILIQDNGQ
jgi:hypothetical protein